MRVSIGAAAPGGALKGTADQIADRLRAAIEDGALAPGEALNQVDLAAQFGLSRIPIREALRRLEAEGYVTYQPNKGATVVGLGTADDVAEIIDVRECLELQLCEHVVRRLDDATLERAASALRALNRARTADELRGAHARFHTVLLDAARRPRTTALINDWRFAIDSHDTDGARRRAFARAMASVHSRLLASFARRDVRGARACVREEHDYMRANAARLTARATLGRTAL